VIAFDDFFAIIISEKDYVDSKRVYLMGASMGGYMGFSWERRYNGTLGRIPENG
jgi:predicted peptidase